MLQTCRYKFVDGKVITKMFGMKVDGSGEWAIESGWCHDKKEAMAANHTDKTQVVVEPLKSEQEDLKDIESKASRFARKLADELNLDINLITGTGKNGLINKDDVTNHYNSLES